MLNGTEISISGSGEVSLGTSEGLRLGLNRLWVQGVIPGDRRTHSDGVTFTIARPAQGLVSINEFTTAGREVHIRLERDGHAQVSAKLNGQEILGWSGHASEGKDLSLPVSAFTGLTHGQNVLTVEATYDAENQEVSRTIQVGPEEIIPGHRVINPFRVGEKSTLDATSTLMPRELEEVARTIEWRVIALPEHSGLDPVVQVGEQIPFTPDEPGEYSFEVSVTAGDRSASSILTATATYADPLVPISSVTTTNSVPGIQVGSTLYLDPSNTSTATAGYLQVLVLNRGTLAKVDNRSFSPSNIAALDSYLQTLNSNDLVIVNYPPEVSQAGSGSTIPSGNLPALDAALGRIGGVTPKEWGIQMGSCWSGNMQYCYSVDSPQWHQVSTTTNLGSFWTIGVPGMTAGAATRDNVAQHGNGGRLGGYLTRGTQPGSTVDDYVYVFGSDQNVRIDTCAGANPTAGCTVQIGSTTYTSPAGANGIFVVSVDRVTLQLLSQGVATTDTELTTLLSGGAIPPRGHIDASFAPPVWDGRLLVLQSVGNGKLTLGSGIVLPLLDKYGLSVEAFTAAVTAGSPYAAVGVASKLPFHGTGVESSPVINESYTGRIHTLVERKPDARYSPAAVDPLGTADFDLATILYQPKTPWSHTDPSSQQAIAYIAQQIQIYDPATGQGYPDIRSAYPNKNLNFSGTDMDPTKVPYPASPAPGFPSPVDYASIQTQLLSEFGWVTATRTLISNMELPMDQDQWSQAVSTDQIADQITNSLRPPAGPTKIGWLSVFTDVFSLGSKLAAATGQPEVSGFLGVFSTAGQLVQDVSALGQTSDQIKVTSTDLSNQLALQQQAKIYSMERAEEVIVADSGKLQTVGSKVKLGTWKFSSSDNIDVANALDATTRGAVYGALMPLVWQAWQMVPFVPSGQTPVSSTPKSFVCGWRGAVWHTDRPFWTCISGSDTNCSKTNAPDTSWIPGNINDSGRTYSWILASLNSHTWTDGLDGPGKGTAMPPASLTDDIFKFTASTSSNPNSDFGAGQYAPQWFRNTYNPPSHVDCWTDESLGDVPKLVGPPSMGPAASQADLG